MFPTTNTNKANNTPNGTKVSTLRANPTNTESIFRKSGFKIAKQPRIGRLEKILFKKPCL